MQFGIHQPVTNLIKVLLFQFTTLGSYWLDDCPEYDLWVVNYARKMFLRLGTEQQRKNSAPVNSFHLSAKASKENFCSRCKKYFEEKFQCKFSRNVLNKNQLLIWEVWRAVVGTNRGGQLASPSISWSAFESSWSFWWLKKKLIMVTFDTIPHQIL